MKRYSFIFLLVLGAFGTAQAQFDLDLLFGGASLGYAKPTGDFNNFAKGGFTYYGVLGYKLTDEFRVGGQYNSAVTASLDSTISTGILGVELYSLNSYLLKAWYTPTPDNAFKPYAALGFGLATVEEPTLIAADGSEFAGNKRTGLGLNIDLGVNIKGFDLNYSYNLNGATAEMLELSPAASDLSANFHRFAVGYVYNF